MVLLDVKFYIEVNDSFDPQHLRNLQFNIDDSSKHAEDGISTNSYFCTKVTSLDEIDRMCNLERTLKGIVGIIRIQYIECKSIPEKPKVIPTWRKPWMIIIYETIGIASGIITSTHLALSGNEYVWIEVAGIIIGFFLVEYSKHLKKIG